MCLPAPRLEFGLVAGRTAVAAQLQGRVGQGMCLGGLVRLQGACRLEDTVRRDTAQSLVPVSLDWLDSRHQAPSTVAEVFDLAAQFVAEVPAAVGLAVVPTGQVGRSHRWCSSRVHQLRSACTAQAWEVEASV